LEEFDLKYPSNKMFYTNLITDNDEVNDDVEKIWTNHAVVSALLMSLVADPTGTNYSYENANEWNIWGDYL